MDIKPPHRSPPRRGLSLGWRLSLSLAVVVTVVMGGITLPQQVREIQERKRSHVEDLRTSLAPLVTEFESASRPEDALRALQAFHRAYLRQGRPDHQLLLVDMENRILFSTLSAPVRSLPNAFQAEIPVTSPAIPGLHGKLTVLEDATGFHDAVRRKWRVWARHMALTVLAILLFLLPSVRFLVTRPLEFLVDEIGRMEKGYWNGWGGERGAWEIRWVAWRFRNLGVELQKTVERLYAAERRAREAGDTRGGEPPPSLPRTGVPETTGLPPSSKPDMRERLLMACLQMESLTPEAPGSRRIASQALAKDALKADRLGLHEVKARLENAAYRILEPENFRKLDDRLNAMTREYRTWKHTTERLLRKALDAQRLPYLDLQFRIKHTAGVLKKMSDQGLDLAQIHDLYAFRIIVPTEADCYWALGLIHETFRPIVGRFKDYIANPKPNGYQSLHTSVHQGDGRIFEIQMRSAAMHGMAEQGQAAHWVYKKSVVSSGTEQATPAGWSGRIRELVTGARHQRTAHSP